MYCRGEKEQKKTLYQKLKIHSQKQRRCVHKMQNHPPSGTNHFLMFVVMMKTKKPKQNITRGWILIEP